MTGKWHLGHTPETNPAWRDFDRSFARLDCAAFPFSNLPQANAEVTGFHADRYTQNGSPVEQLANFYSTQFYATRLIRYIDEDIESGDPFFAHLAFTVPISHPLWNQALGERSSRVTGSYYSTRICWSPNAGHCTTHRQIRTNALIYQSSIPPSSTNSLNSGNCIVLTMAFLWRSQRC